jgi:hypothetical protein
VIDIIEEAKKYIESFITMHDNSKINNSIYNSILNKINGLLDDINDYKKESSSYIWDYLIDELHICKESLNNPGQNDSANILAQHTTYLGRMKGIRATSSSVNTPIRGFSNSVQMKISSQLHTLSSPIPIPPPPFGKLSRSSCGSLYELNGDIDNNIDDDVDDDGDSVVKTPMYTNL